MDGIEFDSNHFFEILFQWYDVHAHCSAPSVLGDNCQSQVPWKILGDFWHQSWSEHSLKSLLTISHLIYTETSKCLSFKVVPGVSRLSELDPRGGEELVRFPD